MFAKIQKYLSKNKSTKEFEEKTDLQGECIAPFNIVIFHTEKV